ncbi:hypothetical protein [Trueperella bialowiezensis]|uniref:Uncharacterized protein n=1 Tax=Trueperella bialowiezensis TaxID=312285 RepID=A0A448PE38_9ACTO|nr:hypothetical protein [Trueperella bialowiezensis]VEI13207.1 Uncharacterised protein [Trueperella bialowiezensis]
MSFSSIHDCAINTDFRNRIAVCATQLGAAPAGGEAFATQHALAIAAHKPIADAWETSLTEQPYHSRRGWDENIISDQLIRRAVRRIAKLDGEPDPA